MREAPGAATASVVVRMLDPSDAAVLAPVAPDVFDNHLDEVHCVEFISDPRHHIAVALSGDVVVGMATAVHYVHPDKPAELWINEVGVALPFTRKGIGTQLMTTMFAYARGLGCGQAWVLTEKGNTAARGLYVSVGGSEHSAVSVTFDLGSPS